MSNSTEQKPAPLNLNPFFQQQINECKDDDCPTDQNFVFQVDNELNLKPIITDDIHDYAVLQETDLTVGLNMSEDLKDQVKEIVKTYISSFFGNVDENFNDIEIEQLAHEAHVEMRSVEGFPVVFVVWEKESYSPLNDSMFTGFPPDERTQDSLGIFGTALNIPMNQAVQILDGAEISLYGVDNSEDMGFAIRLKKQIGNARFVTSILQHENSRNNPDFDETQRVSSASLELSLTQTSSFLAEISAHNTPLNRGAKFPIGSSHDLTTNFEEQVRSRSILIGHVNQNRNSKTQFGLRFWSLEGSEETKTTPHWTLEMAHTLYNNYRKGYEWGSKKFPARIKLRVRRKGVRVSVSVPF